ncbi:hypothetical protein TUN199_05134, partial [Pyrenophora tritici-repentis]
CWQPAAVHGFTSKRPHCLARSLSTTTDSTPVYPSPTAIRPKSSFATPAGSVRPQPHTPTKTLF